MSCSQEQTATRDPGGAEEISDSEFLDIELENLQPETPESCDGLSPALGNDCGTESETVEGPLIPKTDSAEEAGTPPELAGVSAGAGEGSTVLLRRKRVLAERSPLERFRLRYLCVTDVCGQAWCELQVVYGFELPHVPKREEESPEVKAGASIHLARELEVHDVVSVSAQSREDRWALKILNMLSMLPILQAGRRVRELPVFGMLEGVFLVGVIDELHYSHKGELVLSELKTRGPRSLPGRAQERSHHFQVRLYKLLFDSMVRGLLERDAFVQSLNLRPEQPLGSGVMEHAQKLGLHVHTFGGVLELALMNLSYSELPAIDVLKIEYCHQGSSDAIGTREVSFDEAGVRAELRNHLSYWIGQREPRGVDIEEAWKCRSCSFEEHCEWRRERAENATASNQTKRFK
ncbi:exonuclease V-like [Acipenser ruthenus]|uniref:exonuclease V-like n=1 Tax=Acipenser ruthenus TaxID=7906 RepID=UPI002741D48F|nr:exonuclease V-like [Acipenser ruthenus]